MLFFMSSDFMELHDMEVPAAAASSDQQPLNDTGQTANFAMELHNVKSVAALKVSTCRR